MHNEQQPLGSGFTAASTADDVLAGIDLTGTKIIPTLTRSLCSRTNCRASNGTTTKDVREHPNLALGASILHSRFFSWSIQSGVAGVKKHRATLRVEDQTPTHQTRETRARLPDLVGNTVDPSPPGRPYEGRLAVR